VFSFEFVVAGYEVESKWYMMIVVGCIGGKHCSVVMINVLVMRLEVIGI